MRFVAALSVCLLACSHSTAPAQAPGDEDAPSPAAKNDPAYRRDIQLICDVDTLAQTETSDALETVQKRDDYLAEHVKQPDAIYFLTVFRSKPDGERGELLLHEARDVKLAACPLAELLAADAPAREK